MAQRLKVAAYTSQTQEQQRFTISEVAVDWHELMVRQRIMQRLTASLTNINPFNARCSKLLLFEGYSAILV